MDKYSDGGEVQEDSGMEEDNDSLMDHCALECMSAIESKDKEAFREAFHVLVADTIHKLAMEMEMKEGNDK